MRINENKFIVTWIDRDGNTRGQATKLKDDAKRMYNFVIEQGAQYAEIRKIGSIVAIYENQQPVAKTEPTPDFTADTLNKFFNGEPN